MKYTRREVLRLTAASSLLPLLGTPGCGEGSLDGGDGLPVYEYSGVQGPSDLFQHGVASGDPLPDAVILWTRVSREDSAPVEVFWEMARDAAFQTRVGAGWFTTDAARDYTVKIDAAVPDAGTEYHYRFFALGRASIVGRTRSAARGATDSLRLAVVSCSSFAHGYFHVYRAVAARPEIDAVLHLGDYIYEYGTGEYGAVREYEPAHEIRTLSDYRTRYAQYRRDLDLQAVHARFAFIGVWDDHEAANDSFVSGAENHTEDAEGPWLTRLEIARRVYAEWMPIREQPDGRIFRSFHFGDLVDLAMLDTRLWGRDVPAASPTDTATINDAGRTLLGFDQEAWLENELRASTAQWRLIGQQVVFTQLKLQGAPNSQGGGTIFNPDQWDGYAPARQRLLDLVRTESIANVVVLSGDIHSSGAGDVSDDPNNPEAYDPATGAGSLAVEFVTPGVTSPSFGEGSNQTVLPLIKAQNPHIKFADVENRGYTIINVTRERVHASWYHFTRVDESEAAEQFAASYQTLAGSSRVTAG